MLCKKRGEVLVRHNALKHEWRTLCGHALGRSNVFEKPTLKTCQDVCVAGAREGRVPDKDLQGDVAVHNFWKAGCCAVFDVCVTDTDAPLQQGMDPMSARHEKEKKKRYLQHCTDRHRSFTPLVFLVDGLFSSECLAAVRQLAYLLAEKWTRKYSAV